jgi:hypothetical protein
MLKKLYPSKHDLQSTGSPTVSLTPWKKKEKRRDVCKIG